MRKKIFGSLKFFLFYLKIVQNLITVIVEGGVADPNFFIPDPGSKRFRIPDPISGSASKHLSNFNPRNCV
jgi:hypothetical protein